jgi:hypothetical protein
VRTVGYAYRWNTKTGTQKFLVEISEVPVVLWLWQRFWEWVDPCCRRPWRLWAPLVPIAHRAYNIGWNHQVADLEVSEEWARKNFDWDISEFLSDPKETDDQDSSRT